MEVANSRVRRGSTHTSIAAFGAVLLAAGLLSFPSHSREAGPDTQSSVNVAVVPGFTAPIYPPYGGVGTFPATNPRLSAYHFNNTIVRKLAW